MCARRGGRADSNRARERVSVRARSRRVERRRRPALSGRGGRITTFVAASLVVASAFSFAARVRTQAPVSAPVQAFVGTYRNRVADNGESAIRAGVERVVSQMGLLTGAIARRRLIANDPPIPRITIAANRDGLIIDYTAGRRNATSRLGVYTDNPAADGGRVQVKHEIVGNRIRESYHEGSGRGVNVLELAPDGNRLALEVTISSRHLPDDVVFRMSFDRVR